MSRYEGIFDQVGNAKPLNNWEPSLPQGKHRVAMVRYGGKVSGKDKTVFLEAEFVILSTDNEAVTVGAKYSCPWFINRPDEYGYTHSRAKDFLETVQKCITNDDDVRAFGQALAEDFESDAPQGYGISLDVAVVPVMNAKGEARRGKKGNEVFNAAWTAVIQSSEDIAATRNLLLELATHPPMKRTPPAQAQEADPTPAANGKKLGGLTLLARRS